jgi:hypothetical protein
MKVLVENCTWANIGDGFYQMSVTVMLQRLFPHWDIYQQDGPQSRSFRYGPRFAPNVLNLMDYQRADLHVFTGPVVGQQLLTRYRKIIEDHHPARRPVCPDQLLRLDDSGQVP